MSHRIPLVSLAVLLGFGLVWFVAGGNRAVVQHPRPVFMSVIFLGDTHPGDNYQESRARRGRINILERFGYGFSFTRLQALLSSADHVVANLETPLSTAREHRLPNKPYIHWSDGKRSSKVLRDIGVDAVSLANNHTMDLGVQGLEDTITALEHHGLEWFGAGLTEERALEPLTLRPPATAPQARIDILSGFEHRGNYDEKYGFYAAGDKPGVAPLKKKGVGHIVRSWRKNNRQGYLIAFPHWGKNYMWRTGHQRKLAKRLIKAGVDLVIGHGAHRFQEIERYQGRFILYNLGNFVMNSRGRYGKLNSTPYSIIAKLELSRDTGELRKRLKLYPINSDNRTSGFQPYLLKGVEFNRFSSLLLERSDADLVQAGLIKRSRDRFGEYLYIDLD